MIGNGKKKKKKNDYFVFFLINCSLITNKLIKETKWATVRVKKSLFSFLKMNGYVHLANITYFTSILQYCKK